MKKILLFLLFSCYSYPMDNRHPNCPPCPIVMHKETQTDNQEKCSICLEEWRVDDDIRELPCRHKFHTTCIQRWLEEDAGCPLCRNRINSHLHQQGICHYWCVGPLDKMNIATCEREDNCTDTCCNRTCGTYVRCCAGNRAWWCPDSYCRDMFPWNERDDGCCPCPFRVNEGEDYRCTGCLSGGRLSLRALPCGCLLGYGVGYLLRIILPL